MSAPRIAVRPSTRMIVAITRRPKSWRVNAAISSRRWVSMCGCSGASAARRGDGLIDEGLDLVLGQLLGEVLGQDRDLRLFLRGQVLAGALAKRLDRLTPGLDLPGQDGRVVVLDERPPLAFLEVVGRALGHPQDIAPQRVTRPHRGRNVGLDPITK